MIVLCFSSQGVQLGKEFHFTTSKGKKHTVPALFPFDGQTVPSWSKSIVGGSYRPRTLPASLIHDYLLSIDDPHANREYYHRLKIDNVRFAWVFYLAVSFWRWWK